MENNTDTISAETAPNINYDIYSENLDEQKRAIVNKIEQYEIKLLDLEIKETMLNNIIIRTNATLEGIDVKNFKWIGQTQANLMKQIENLGLLKDIIIKYEDMIFKYRKVLLEINEKALGNRIKINTVLQEEMKEEDDINSVLTNIQEILKTSAVDGSNPAEIETNSGTLFLDNIKQELEENDY